MYSQCQEKETAINTSLFWQLFGICISVVIKWSSMQKQNENDEINFGSKIWTILTGEFIWFEWIYVLELVNIIPSSCDPFVRSQMDFLLQVKCGMEWVRHPSYFVQRDNKIYNESHIYFWLLTSRACILKMVIALQLEFIDSLSWFLKCFY